MGILFTGVSYMLDWMDELLPAGTPGGQARAVMRDDELVTVGAGAGTGKTWVLSARFARLLFQDGTDGVHQTHPTHPTHEKCLPQNILTLTFTEAAAREMQERIRARALKMTAARPGQEEEWQAVKEGFDETWISTIHSFASRLIRESGLSLDLDPYSGVVSAPQEEIFWGTLERALECLDLSSLAELCGDKSFLKIAERLENDEVFISALEKWGPSGLRVLARDVFELQSSLGRGYDAMLAWADQAERSCAEPGSDPQASEAFNAVLGLLRPRWDEAWDLWRDIFAELGRGILDERDKILVKQNKQEKSGEKRANPAVALAGIFERWGGALSAPEGDADAKRAFYLDICANLSGVNSNLFKKIAERLGQTSSEWRKAQEKWAALSGSDEKMPLSAAEQRLRAVLLRFSAFAWRAWDEMKKRRSLLSFSDMIRFAAQSVKDDPRAKGFRHVLIDEFQDTDPLQDAMIQALRAKEGAKLFLVGDPKQAIYRFRHADLTLFADYVLQSRKRGSDIALDVSFRTRSSLMRIINSMFAHIWRNGLGTGRLADLKFEPLTVPELPERESASVPTFTLLLSVRKGREAGTARERLAAALADMMARLVEDGRTVWDKENKCLRPVTWRDMAVLTPTRSEYEILEAAFEARGVPASFEKSKSYFSRGEVTDVVNVLRAAAFPGDEAALAGWLSSPFSGVPQREAVGCVQALASSSLSLEEILPDLLPDASERLSYLRRVGGLKGPSAVLSLLTEDRRYLAAFEPSQRLRVTGNVNRAVSSARQYERDVSHSLAGCAEWLDSALRSGAPAEEPDLSAENADAVRVMTVHASKGLEFPVVAVTRMERSPRGRSNAPVAASKTLGAVFTAFPDMIDPDMIDKDEQTPVSMLWERALSEQSELEESQRLFYVAATRARDSLILCGLRGQEEASYGVQGSATPGAAPGWLSWTMDWLNAGEGRTCVSEVNKNCIVTIDESAEIKNPSKKQYARPTAAEPEALELPGPDETMLSSFSATSFALFEWCPFAWRRRHRQGLDLRWEIPDDDRDEIGGPELGSVAHWILSRWDMRKDTLHLWLDMEDTARRMPTHLRGAWRDAGNKKALREWLAAFAASEEGNGLASAARDGVLVRESAFSVTLPALLTNGEFSGLRLVGAMDALWREGGSWHVRDYKITLSDNAPDELYRAQLTFYALVVKELAERRSLPFDDVDVALVFLREGGRAGSASRFPRNGDWAAMTDEITAAARGAAEGPWIPKRVNCARCPWRIKCPRY